MDRERLQEISFHVLSYFLVIYGLLGMVSIHVQMPKLIVMFIWYAGTLFVGLWIIADMRRDSDEG